MDSFCVAVFGNADGGIIEVVFINSSEIAGNRADEGELSTFGGSSSSAIDTISDIDGTSDASELGKIANDEFFGGG